MISELLAAWLAFGFLGSAALLTPLLRLPLVAERVALRPRVARRR
jgi:hypothetical protein